MNRRNFFGILLLAIITLCGTGRCAALESAPGRYQVVYGQVGALTGIDGTDHGCFLKIDTTTGDTWVYCGDNGMYGGWRRVGTSAENK